MHLATRHHLTAPRATAPLFAFLGLAALGSMSSVAFGWDAASDERGQGSAPWPRSCGQERGSQLPERLGGPRSVEKAREFYKISADTREPEAALWLGEMYRDGAFGSPDMASARPLFKIAAEQGLLHAMDAYAFSLFSVDQTTGLM